MSRYTSFGSDVKYKGEETPSLSRRPFEQFQSFETSTRIIDNNVKSGKDSSGCGTIHEVKFEVKLLHGIMHTLNDQIDVDAITKEFELQLRAYLDRQKGTIIYPVD